MVQLTAVVWQTWKLPICQANNSLVESLVSTMVQWFRWSYGYSHLLVHISMALYFRISSIDHCMAQCTGVGAMVPAGHVVSGVMTAYKSSTVSAGFYYVETFQTTTDVSVIQINPLTIKLPKLRLHTCQGHLLSTFPMETSGGSWKTTVHIANGSDDPLQQGRSHLGVLHLLPIKGMKIIFKCPCLEKPLIEQHDGRQLMIPLKSCRQILITLYLHAFITSMEFACDFNKKKGHDGLEKIFFCYGISLRYLQSLKLK